MSDRGLLNSTTVGLRPNKDLPTLYAPTHRPEEAAIVAEICARLIEWRSLHLIESAPFNWIQRISSLALDHPDAFWLYISLQSGDLSALTKTYQEQAQERCLDRQSLHERHQSAVHTMSLHFPELQHVIKDLHSIFKPSRGIGASKDLTGPS